MASEFCLVSDVFQPHGQEYRHIKITRRHCGNGVDWPCPLFEVRQGIDGVVTSVDRWRRDLAR